MKANCTTPIMNAYDKVWIYNCSGYYAKYRVWSTVKIIGPKGGGDGIYAQKIDINGTIKWVSDGLIIDTAGLSHKTPKIVKDGSGGAIISWDINDIDSQRINSDGVKLWSNSAGTICSANNVQQNQEMIIDEEGGTIIVWQDLRDGNNDIYAQRINSNGISQWNLNGISICNEDGSQELPQIVPDGEGGAIIIWQDNRTGNFDIFSQKINSNGIPQWSLNGNIITNDDSEQINPQIVSDGEGGAIVVWQDNNYGDLDIYSQRINSSGYTQWIDNGTIVCDEEGDQQNPQIVTDQDRGAIVVWQDNRNGDFDIYSQRINSSGQTQWIDNGTAVCDEEGEQQNPQIASDGLGGAFIIWEDNYNIFFLETDIYTQKINSSGIKKWDTSGVSLCTANGEQYNPKIVSDGIGGAIVVWQDFRNGNNDIYSRRVDSDGDRQWITNGISICDEIGDQINPEIISDGNGGAIIVWDDNRYEEDDDIPDDNGDGDNDDGNGDSDWLDRLREQIPGYNPLIILIISSICGLVIILRFYANKNMKFKSNNITSDEND